MRILGLAPLAALLVACTISEDDFPAEYAETWCDRAQECDPDGFEDLFGDDVEQCEELNGDAAEVWLDLADLAGETYDEGLGYECVRDTKKASCDELEDGDVDCDVWTDE